MNVGEIALRVKRQFGDEAGAQITDADIIRWVNDAMRDIAVHNNLLQAVANTAAVAGQTKFAMPADVLQIKEVYFSTTSTRRRLDSLAWEEAVEQGLLEQINATGEPQYYYIFGGEFNVHPSVEQGGTLAVYYVKRPVEVTVVGDVPVLPQQYHNRIVEYCIAQAYELDDNFESYSAKMRQFQEGVDRMKNNDELSPQDVYPSITVATQDYGDSWGGW